MMEEERLKVLAIDDEPGVLKLIHLILRRDYIVTTVSSPKEGLNLLESSKVDILLTDLKMPGADGLTVVQRTKEMNPETLVIVVTGFGDKKAAVDSLKAGAFDFIEKPFEEGELTQSVRRAASFIELRNSVAKQKAEIHQKLVQASKLTSLGEMAAGIAHELNNPITAISGFTMLLGKEPDLSERSKSFVTRIEKSVARMKKLTTHLRTFAREGTKKENWEPINCTDVIEDSIMLLEPRLKYARIDIVRKFETNMPKIVADYSHLESVYQNLLSNSIDAFESLDKDVSRKIIIDVHYDKEAESVVTVYEDNAGGIPEAVLHKIFEPFFTTKPAGKGTGLGMSILFGIIKDHQGKIEASSEEGKGTIFEISLPTNRKEKDEMAQKDKPAA